MWSWVIRNKILSMLLALFVTLGLVLAFSSLLVTTGLRWYLEDHADEVKINNLQVKLWQGALTLDDFDLSNTQGQRLSFKDLQIGIHWQALWDNSLHISHFAVSDLKGDMALEAFTPTRLGPLVLSKLSQSNLSDGDEQDTVWSIIVDSIELNDVDLCMTDTVHDFHGLGIALNDNSQFEACIQWQALNISDTISISTNQALDISFPLVIEGLVSRRPNDEHLFSIARLAVAPLVLSPEVIRLQQLSIDTLKLLSQADHDVANYGLLLQQLNSEVINYQITKDRLLIEPLQLNQIEVHSRAATGNIHSLLRAEALTIEQLQFQTGNLSLSSLEVISLNLLENIELHNTDSDYLTQIDRLALANLKLNPEVTSASSLSIEKLVSEIVLDESGNSLNRWFAEAQPEPESVVSDSAKPLAIAIDNIKLSDASVAVVDQRLGKSINHRIDEIQIETKDFKINQASEQASEIDYQMRLNESGKLVGSGSLSMDEMLTLDLKGQLKSFDLVSVTDYASRYIGYRIDQGQLDVDYQLAIAQGKIEANFKNLFEKFELGQIQDHEKHELNQALGVPLPMALNLLRDGDNKIALDIPVKGDMYSPDFSISDVVSTIAVKAIKNAIIFHYSPLGMLSLASGVVDLATALRFEPLVYTRGATEITEGHQRQLTKIITVMKQKPRIKVVVCAVATQVDGQPEPQQEVNQSVTPEAVSAEVLIELAKQRQLSVIDYLVEGGIARERLLGCNIKLATNLKASPQVKISI